MATIAFGGHAMPVSPVKTDKRKNLDFKAGDTVRVFLKIEEKGKTRLQSFEGLVLTRKHGTEPGATFTVRRVTSGVGVEKIFPLYSPVIDKIEVVKRSKTRRAKLYYIREKAAKAIQKKLRSTAVFSSATTEPEEQEMPDTSNVPEADTGEKEAPQTKNEVNEQTASEETEKSEQK